MKKFILLTSSLSLALVASIAISAGAPVANIFKSGDPAVAADVNANFQELADRIDAIPNKSSYNYNDYIPAADQTNVFDIIYYDGTTPCQAKARYQYEHTTENTEPVLKRTYTATDAADTPCAPSDVVHTFYKRSNALEFEKRESVDRASGAVNSTDIYDQPRRALTANMQNGSTWATASLLSKTDISGTTVSTFIEQRALVGVEDVTVPYNGTTTYTGCLKVINMTNENVRWFCPGIGLVKSMRSGSIWELSDIQ